jgi:hypothetical protein
MKFPLLRGSAAAQQGEYIRNVSFTEPEEGTIMVLGNGNEKSYGFFVTYFQDQQG